MAEQQSKVIFLDIDGVLINSRFMAQRTADPTCVRNLNILAGATGSVVVVSSTWRSAGLGRVIFNLQGWGVTADIIGTTPEMSTLRDGIWLGVPRWREIQAWVVDHQPDHFVILDDEGDMGDLTPHWVPVDCETGLTARNVIAATEILTL